MRSYPISVQVNKYDQTWQIRADFTPAVPARTYGPPERCYDAEPAEFENVIVQPVNADDSLGPDMTEFLSMVTWYNERQAALTELLEEAERAIARAADRDSSE